MACGNKDNFSGCEKTSTVKDAGQEMEEIKKKSIVKNAVWSGNHRLWRLCLSSSSILTPCAV